MTKALEEAIAKVRDLPKDRQEYAAAVLEAIATKRMWHTTDEERRLIDEGLESGIMTDEQTKQFWNRRKV